MPRDHRKLKVFQLADALVVDVYRATTNFPAAETYGLRAQIRRAAVSVPTNLVEGCARRSTKDYLHFVGIALGSASETRYLLDLSYRLGFLPAEYSALERRYEELVRALHRLLGALDTET